MRSVILFLLLSNFVFAETVTGDFLGAKFTEQPSWFKSSFLDLPEDLTEATESNKHIMLYFHQNGCPYCAKLVAENFHDPVLVSQLTQNFDTIEINLWGDKSLNDWTGAEFSEKTFSEKMQVQFTPTLMFLNKQGEVVLRLNGYFNQQKMHKALNFVQNKLYEKQNFSTYIDNKTFNNATLNKSSLFEGAPHILSRSVQFPADKYLAVFFEKPNCTACDKFHKGLMKLKATQDMLKKMQVVQINLSSNKKLMTPNGAVMSGRNFYQSLNLNDAPSVVFFDKTGQEIIRKDAFFKAFHWHGILRYVLSGAYQQQANFQRFLEEESLKIRKTGVDVDLWK
jgi:thioredoxin-related protein